MRVLLPFLLMAALSTGCGDPFADAQKLDTIEAYEQFLADNPNSPFRVQAEIRLEELMWDQAKEARTVEAYDAVLARFPKGKGQLYDKIWEERRQVLFDTADEQDTVALWQQYLDQYPSGEKKMKEEARTRIKLAEHLAKLEIGMPEQEQINLARDPDGPLNGWEFRVDVTYQGEEPMQYLNMRLYYLDETGRVLDTDEWPAVAKHLPGYLPFREGFDKPMAKGETRTWIYTTGDLPAGWAKKVKVKPIKIGFAKDPEEED